MTTFLALALLVLLSAPAYPAYVDPEAPVIACESWLVTFELAQRTDVERETADLAAVGRGLCRPLAKAGCTYQNEVKEGLPIVCLAPSLKPAACLWAVTDDMARADFSDGDNSCQRQALAGQAPHSQARSRKAAHRKDREEKAIRRISLNRSAMARMSDDRKGLLRRKTSAQKQRLSTAEDGNFLRFWSLTALSLMIQSINTRLRWMQKII